MKNKKILCAFLTALLAVSAVSCGSSDESSEESTTGTSEAVTEDTSAEKESTDVSENTTEAETEKSADNVDINDYITSEQPEPALWKVTDKESGNELYMMGTIHIAGDNTFPLPDYIMDVYESCDGIAVEYDVNAIESDYSLMQEFVFSMAYADGSTIKDHLSEETYEKAKGYFQEIGQYNELLDIYTSGFWISQIQSMALLSIENMNSSGVDATFLSYAAEDKKEIVNIETLEIQAAAITAYSDELADYLLEDLIDNIDDVESLAETFGEMYNAWADGDIDLLADIDSDTEGIPEELVDDYMEYQNFVVNERNEGMAEKAAEFIENGDNYFFMVGALHFAGENGVDDMLEDMGYTVERIA